MHDKNLYIIAGCNGAGKTTASFTILPEIIACKEFVNADEIAKGISPFQPEKVALEAGRIMLSRIDELLKNGITFAFETTLASRVHKQKILYAKRNGYTTTLLFFWLQNVELAKERVKIRVSEGGHSIEPAVIQRRYLKGLVYLFDIYLPIVHNALIFDNSSEKASLISKKGTDSNIEVVDTLKFNLIKKYYDSHRKAK